MMMVMTMVMTMVMMMVLSRVVVVMGLKGTGVEDVVVMIDMGC